MGKRSTISEFCKNVKGVEDKQNKEKMRLAERHRSELADILLSPEAREIKELIAKWVKTNLGKRVAKYSLGGDVIAFYEDACVVEIPRKGKLDYSLTIPYEVFSCKAKLKKDYIRQLKAIIKDACHTRHP